MSNKITCISVWGYVVHFVNEIVILFSVIHFQTVFKRAKMQDAAERVPENGTECENSQDSMDTDTNTSKGLSKKKIKKKGIIYLSTIPPYMNVAKIREIFSQFGGVGRIYLQPTSS